MNNFLNKFVFIKNDSDQDISLIKIDNSIKDHIKTIFNKNSTGFFILKRSIVLQKIAESKEALASHWGGESLIAFSLKTNYAVASDKIIKQQVGLNVCSNYELESALKLKYPGDQLVFTGQLKNKNSLILAAKNKVKIIAENNQQIKEIRTIFNSEKIKVNIGLRLHLKNSRFGFYIHDPKTLLTIKRINQDKTLSLSGFHFHLGTNSTKVNKFRNASQQISNFIKSNNEINKDKIDYLDFGGGFPVNRPAPFGHNKSFLPKKNNWDPRPINEYIEAITTPINGVYQKDSKSKPQLIIEPGRLLVDESTIFVSRVINTVSAENKQGLIINASIGMLPLSHYNPHPITCLTKNLNKKSGKEILTTIYGASAMEDDIIFEGYLPTMGVDDVIIFNLVGAYNYSMSQSFIFNKPNFYIIK